VHQIETVLATLIISSYIIRSIQNAETVKMFALKYSISALFALKMIWNLYFGIYSCTVDRIYSEYWIHLLLFSLYHNLFVTVQGGHTKSFQLKYSCCYYNQWDWKFFNDYLGEYRVEWICR